MRVNDTGDRRTKGATPAVGLLITGALIVTLGLFDTAEEPAPELFTLGLLPVIYTTYVGGMGYGFVSGAMLILYGVWTFSLPGQLLSYSKAGAAHLVATSVVTLLTVVLVGMLKRRAERISETLRAKADVEAQLDEQRRMRDELETRVKQRTAELAESEDRFASLLRSVNDVVWAASADGSRMLYMNPAAAEVYGRPADDFVEAPDLWLDAVHPEDREIAGKTKSDLFTHGHAEAVYRIVRPDGEVRWINDRKSVVFDNSGKPLRIGGIATDVTDHMRAEEELRKSSAALEKLAEEQKTLLKHTRDFVYRHDTNGIFTYLSPGIEQTTGYSVEEWRKHYTTYMTDNPINEQVVTNTEETLRTGKESPPYLVEIRHKSGHSIVLEVNERPYFEQGSIAGIIGVARDVTERVCAEEALRQSEELLQGIIDNSPAVIYLKNLDGRFVLTNRRFDELFHLTGGMAVGRTDHDLFVEDVADAFRANDCRVLEGGEAVEFEELAPHDDGMHTYISLKFPLFDADGKPTGVCGISTDITDRKRAAEAVQSAREAAEAANRAKSRFLANISHEIRTPITAMLGAAELIRSKQDTGLEHYTSGDMILRNGRHLLALVNDLLDMSKLEAGRLEVHPTRCSLLEIMADVDAVTASLRRDASVEYRVIYETNVPSHIHTDRTRLAQAVINLVNNALKFTRVGHVQLGVRVDRDADDPRLTITVEDTGPGIQEEHLDNIFDAFAQVESSDNTTAVGVGLGLPISRWIAEQLGGALTVDSTPGRGSTFRLRVNTGPVDDVEWLTPRHKEKEASSAAGSDRAARSPGLSGTILLAEDVDDSRHVMEKALTAAGAEVVTASNGREAVDLAAKRRFDLILLDIRMPIMDGISAAAELRRQGYHAALIALTASASDSEGGRILSAGFDDVWCKPISLEELVTRVGAYLDEATDDTDKPEGVISRTSDSSTPSRMTAIAADFARSLPTRMKRLHSAIENRNSDELYDLLHQLVGTSGVHGFMGLSTEAARLLAALKEGTLVEQPTALNALTEAAAAIAKSAAGSLVASSAASNPAPPNKASPTPPVKPDSRGD